MTFEHIVDVFAAFGIGIVMVSIGIGFAITTIRKALK